MCPVCEFFRFFFEGGEVSLYLCLYLYLCLCVGLVCWTWGVCGFVGEAGIGGDGERGVVR